MPPDWYVIPVLYTAAAFCLMTVSWHLRGWWNEHFPERQQDTVTQIPMPGYPGVDSIADESGDTQAVEEDALYARWAGMRESYKGEKS